MQKEQQGQFLQTDFYTGLSTEEEAAIDMDDALVMNIFNNDMIQHPLLKNISTSYPISNSTNNTNEFTTSQDFMNFDTLFNMDYNPFYPSSFDVMSPRRHSVAVSPSSSSSSSNRLNLRLPVDTSDHRASLPDVLSPRTDQSKRSLGIPVQGRRQSVASPQDISTWHHIVKEAGKELPVIKEDYPIITQADMDAAQRDKNAIPRRQNKRFQNDEYTPNWVRYTGQFKEGYCDTCQGGKWLQLKNSAFWYHKQFYHGISSVSGKPFERPLEQRQGEHEVMEGLCHQCQRFVPLCNSKRKNNVLWYRHAHKCHVYDKPKGIKTTYQKKISKSINQI